MTFPLFFFSLFVTATLTPNGNNVAPLPLGPRTHIRKNFKKLKLGSASQDQSHSISERCFSTTKNALFINRVEIENLEKFKYYDIDCFLKIQLKKIPTPYYV